MHHCLPEAPGSYSIYTPVLYKGTYWLTVIRPEAQKTITKVQKYVVITFGLLLKLMKL